MAYFEMRVWPYGASHCRGPRDPPVDVRRAQPLAEVGAGGGAVGEQDDIGVTSGDGVGGVREHDLPRGAANGGRVDPARLQAQVFTDIGGWQRALAGGSEAVHVRGGQSGFREGAAAHLCHEFIRVLVVDPSDIGQCDAGDGDFAIH